eukprot:Polyplicarium_translucidae@DN984_c0_g1_i1.p1
MQSLVENGQGGPRSIPRCAVIRDPSDFVKEDSTAMGLLQSLDELHRKYSYIERSLRTELATLESNSLELKDAISVVKSLKTLKEENPNSEAVPTLHKMADNVYVRASIKPTDEVLLWIKADTLLSYSLDDALELLTKNMKAAEGSLVKLEEDINYVRTQLMACELNMATTRTFIQKNSQQAE